jgi:hypothetical protein
MELNTASMTANRKYLSIKHVRNKLYKIFIQIIRLYFVHSP